MLYVALIFTRNSIHFIVSSQHLSLSDQGFELFITFLWVWLSLNQILHFYSEYSNQLNHEVSEIVSHVIKLLDPKSWCPKALWNAKTLQRLKFTVNLLTMRSRVKLWWKVDLGRSWYKVSVKQRSSKTSILRSFAWAILLLFILDNLTGSSILDN